MRDTSSALATIARLLLLPISICLTSAHAFADEAGPLITYHQALHQGEAVVLDVSGDLGADIRVVGTESQRLEVSALPDGSLASSVELKHWHATDGWHLIFDLNPHDQSVQRYLHLHNTGVQVTMRVPKSISLKVDAENGPIVVDNIVAPLTVRLVNGPITVSRAGTVLSLKTVNGPIDVAIADLSRVPDISLSVTNGEIDVTVPRAFKAAVNAHTLIGSVDNSLAESNGPGVLKANVTTGAITLSQR